MILDRSCGILLHVTSLPGNHGIGTLGREAREFAELLKDAGQTCWQILPLGPVSPAFDFSPYATTSAFAGNPYFVSLDELALEKWHGGKIDPGDFDEDHFVDFDRVTGHKMRELERANDLFFSAALPEDLKAYADFCAKEAWWLDDFSLYTALAEHFSTNNWTGWDGDISAREPSALQKWSARLEERVRYHRFVQFIFFRQWRALKKHCNDLGIKIIGDIPIYINLEGADAWASPSILQIDDKTLKPQAVAGVPPDYFSETGQRWGNPIYRWEDDKGRLNEETYAWWKKRLEHLGGLTDIVRIDHFRAFEAYWSIPAKEKTAVKGKWVKGPGRVFFDRLRRDLGDLPLIAEDLGVITEEVRELRDGLGLPGMKILQFAFDNNNRNEYLPHSIENPNCVVYTGTHDNNTTNGWFYGSEIDEERRKYILEYIGSVRFNDFHWQLIRTAYMTTARLAIVPAQDLPGYGHEFRMNTPGTMGSNWRWKLITGGITPEMAGRLREMSVMYRRNGD
jgi:4-alpha-glucanotransferase